MKIKKPESFKLKFHYTQIKTFEDACKRLNISTDLPDVSRIREKYRTSNIAHYKLSIIYEAINNGWEPDWTDENQYKYFPWFEVNDNGLGFSDIYYHESTVDAYIGEGLYTYNDEIALYIGNQFMEEYRQYLLKLN